MKKILLFIVLFPFCVFADIDPADLGKLEGLVTDIYGQQQDIKNEVMSADNHLYYIRQMVYDILTEVSNADLDGNLSSISGNLLTVVVRLGVLKDTLTTLQNVIGEKIDGANNFLFDLKVGLLDFQNLFDTFKTNLEKYNRQLYDTLNGSLYNIEEYLYSINQSLLSIETNVSLITQNTQNIYTELLKMGYDVRSITEYTSNLNSNVNEIWGNTDTIIELLRSMQNTSFSVGSYKLPNFASYYYRDINRVDKFLGDSVSLTLPSSTNFYDAVISRLNQGLTLDVYRNNMVNNQIQRLYDIQTNLYAIVKALSPTNSTEEYEQKANNYIETKKEELEAHLDDMNSYQSSLTSLPNSRLENLAYDSKSEITRVYQDLTINNLEQTIYSGFPEYHSTIANETFSFNFDIKLTSVKQYIDMLRSTVTFVYWVFTFIFSVYLVFLFIRFTGWICSLINPWAYKSGVEQTLPLSSW